MHTQVHYHNSINSSSEWSNSNLLAFWSVCCPENFVLPTLKWGGVFWNTDAHSPRTVHEPQASHKHTHLGRDRGRSGDRGLHPPRLGPAQASATDSVKGTSSSWHPWELRGPVTSQPLHGLSSKWVMPGGGDPWDQEAEHKQDQKLFFCSRSLAHWWCIEEESGESGVVGTPGPKCYQAHMLGPIQKKNAGCSVQQVGS